MFLTAPRSAISYRLALIGRTRDLQVVLAAREASPADIHIPFERRRGAGVNRKRLFVALAAPTDGPALDHNRLLIHDPLALAPYLATAMTLVSFGSKSGCPGGVR